MKAEMESTNEFGANYSLDKHFGGEKIRDVKYRRPGRGMELIGNKSNRLGGRKQLRSSWMLGVHGCFVCGKYHTENKKHPRVEVSAAIRKLKDRHPTTLLRVTDMNAIFNVKDDS